MSFYISWSESEKHADILQPIKKYIIEDTFDTTFALKEMEATYKDPAERVMIYNFSKIGSHKAIGDKIRLTYRLYNSENNEDSTTNKIFSLAKTSNHPLHSYSERPEPVDITIIKDILNVLIEEPPERKDAYTFAIKEGMLGDSKEPLPLIKEYAATSGNFDTFYDEGGYVFEFNNEKIIVDASTRMKDITMEEFLGLSLDDEALT